MPVAEFLRLSGPDVYSFWSQDSASEKNRHQQRVLVLEDAEAMLLERSTDYRNPTAHILNSADGLLGEFFQFHLLCTINCPVEKLDPAILRPGRMTAYREFRRLNRDDAIRLASAKHRSLPEQSDYSLAEIYHAPPISTNFGRKRPIGFHRDAQ